MARTPKARALGGALRQAREEKRLLLRELAAAIGRDVGVLSRWETGERTPRPELVAQILTKLEICGDRFDEIMTLAYRTDESQWIATTLPERRRQMMAYVDWEQKATTIVEVAPLLVPGLLQTGDHFRAMMRSDGFATDEIESRVAHRLARREVITKPEPARLVVFLGQHVLDSDIGGRAVTLTQTRYLVEMAARPNIELRIMPDHCGWHPGLEGEFALIQSTGRTGQSSWIVFIGDRRSVQMLHQPSDVDAYRNAVDKIARISLSREASGKFLADRWEKA